MKELAVRGLVQLARPLFNVRHQHEGGEAESIATVGTPARKKKILLVPRYVRGNLLDGRFYSDINNIQSFRQPTCRINTVQHMQFERPSATT